jgi:hypothetical protein
MVETARGNDRQTGKARDQRQAGRFELPNKTGQFGRNPNVQKNVKPVLQFVYPDIRQTDPFQASYRNRLNAVLTRMLCAPRQVPGDRSDLFLLASRSHANPVDQSHIIYYQDIRLVYRDQPECLSVNNPDTA